MSAMKKTPAQLDRDIAEVLGGSRVAHSTKKSEGTLFAVEIDPHEFESGRDLPDGAKWRKDLPPRRAGARPWADAPSSQGRTLRDHRVDGLPWGAWAPH